VLAWLALLLAVTTMLRLIPGSADWLTLEPAGRGLLPTGLLPSLDGRPATLHLSPGAGYREAAYLVMLAAVCWTSAGLSRTSEAVRKRLLAAVAVAGGLVVALGYLHLLLDMEKVAGIYSPVYAIRKAPFFSTLLNSNNLGGYLLLLPPVCLCLAGDARRAWVRPVALGLALASAAGIVLTWSRSASFALALEAVLVLLLFAAARRRDPEGQGSSNTLPLIAGSIIAVAAGIAASGALDTVLGAPSSIADEAKLMAWRAALSVLSEAPLLGVGAGGFPDAAAAHGALGRDAFVSHVENLPLQILVDHGSILGGAVLVAGGLAVARGIAAARGSLPAQLLWVALLCLALQNMGDFGLWLPGAGVTAAVLVGLLHVPALRVPAAPFIWRPAVIIVIGAATLCTFLAWRYDRRAAWDRFRERVATAAAPDAAEERDLLAYPRDSQALAAMGALTEQRQGTEAALPWLRAAVEAGAERSYPIRKLAASLQRLGRTAEAAATYGLLCKISERDKPEAWRVLILRLDGTQRVIESLTALDPECAADVLDAMWTSGRKEKAYRLAWRLAHIAPHGCRLRFLKASYALALGDLNVASLEASHLIGRCPERAEGFFIEARLRWSDEPKMAMQLLGMAVERSPEWSGLALYWAELAAVAGDEAELERAINAVRQRGGTSPLKEADIRIIRARAAMTHNDHARAARFFRLAGPRVFEQNKHHIAYIRALHETGRHQLRERICRRETTWKKSFWEELSRLCPEGH